MAMKKSGARTPIPIDAETLRPLLEDQPLMALIKTRYVPLSFVLKRVLRRPTPDSAMDVVAALNTLPTGGAATQGLYDLEVQFAMSGGTLCVGAGKKSGRSMGTKGGGTVIDDVTLDLVKEALTPAGRSLGKEFATVHYEPLRRYFEGYERVARECERAKTLKEARDRLKVNDDEWARMKSWMGRFGLLRDIPFGRQLLIDGSLVKEIEQKYLGEKIDDVIPKLLRDALASKEVATV